jgi:hypothetical protein
VAHAPPNPSARPPRRRTPSPWNELLQGHPHGSSLALTEPPRERVGRASVDGGPPDYLELLRLLGATELLLTLAEQVDGEIADEAILAELHELRDRAYSALRQLTER